VGVRLGRREIREGEKEKGRGWVGMSGVFRGWNVLFKDVMEYV
jgi:hypothetical protein